MEEAMVIPDQNLKKDTSAFKPWGTQKGPASLLVRLQTPRRKDMEDRSVSLQTPRRRDLEDSALRQKLRVSAMLPTPQVTLTRQMGSCKPR